MQPTLPTLTADFVYSQLRVALIAGVAYAGGAGYFTPAGVTLSTALIVSLLPLAVSWGFSWYATWGTVKVPVNMPITSADVSSANGDGVNTPAPAGSVIEAAKKAATPFALLLLAGLSLGACTPEQRAASVAATAAIVRAVPDLQSRTSYVCGFVPDADVAAAILRIDTGSVGEIARGICAALKTSIPSYGFMSREPSYKGIILRGKYLP